MSKALKLLPGQFLREYTKRDFLGYRHLVLKRNGFCIFYAEGGCIVNGVKPGSCRAWPFWRKVCTTRRGWERASRRCPGIGKGRAWGADEVKVRLELSP